MKRFRTSASLVLRKDAVPTTGFGVNISCINMKVLGRSSNVSPTQRTESCCAGVQKFLLLALVPVAPVLSLPHLTSIEPCAVTRSIGERKAVFDEHFKPSWDLSRDMTPLRIGIPKGKIAETRRLQVPSLLVLTLQERKYILRAAVAVFCGFVIGFERRSAHSLAGVRVCSLVALGTTILFSISLALAKNSDGLGRAVASAATSVGFLGANVLALNSGRDFRRGLTTSCGIWLSAACGIGMWPRRRTADVLFCWLHSYSLL